MTNRIHKKDKTSKKRIEKLIRQLLIELGENPDKEGLVDTPSRVAEMYQEIFAGYKMNDDDAKLDVSLVSEETDAIVAKDIQFYSICEHHMLPFYGKIQIAYIPSDKIFDISKLNHVVEKYARRLQIQERLTRQIADAVIAMGVKGVSVIIGAKHLCMKMRGVRSDSSMITKCNRGVMEQKEFRDHILPLIYTSSKFKKICGLIRF
jgi:GTP cyclohydrolase I